MGQYDLCSPKTVRELLERYSLSPKKGYGQNFLINRDIPRRIAASAADGSDVGYVSEDLPPERIKGAVALEIGPGVGAMTCELSERFEKVIAVEIDRGLIPLLGDTLSGLENVVLINEDFLKLDLSTLIEREAKGMRVVVCANLPYYVTTPVLMKILEEYPPSAPSAIDSVTVMVQSEVADRICAESSDSAAYGALSVSVALHGDAEKLFNVSPGNFYPAPKVSSSVVRIKFHSHGIYDVYPDAPKDDAECGIFAERVKHIVRTSFLMRRKTLLNALASEFSKDKTSLALGELGIRDDVRGEKLSAVDFCRLTELLYKEP